MNYFPSKSILILVFGIFLSLPSIAAERYKVLVVMSYEEDNPWCQEIKQGIDSVLGATSDIHYLYMDTKVNFAAGRNKAAQAYTYYQDLQPDGVITVDDNAQWMFVVPYLKDKVETPVMFCGVNAEASKYGFPNSHISGTLERGHIRESIAFFKQLKSDFGKVCFMANNSPSGRSLKQQVVNEKQDYIAETAGIFLVNNVDDLKRLSAQISQQCDAVYIDSMEGIKNASGESMQHSQIVEVLDKLYTVPFIGANRYHVEQGAMSAVVKTGQEQGELAAGMLLRAMRGERVSDMLVARNNRGRRIINVTALKKHGIIPRPIVLRGATLVRTTP